MTAALNNAFTDEVEHNRHFGSRQELLQNGFFIERYLTRNGRIFRRLAVSHAAPAGTR